MSSLAISTSSSAAQALSASTGATQSSPANASTLSMPTTPTSFSTTTTPTTLASIDLPDGPTAYLSSINPDIIGTPIPATPGIPVDWSNSTNSSSSVTVGTVVGGLAGITILGLLVAWIRRRVRRDERLP